MAKARKTAGNRPADPQKTNQTYSLKGKNIPIYSFPENTIINGEAYLPLLSQKGIKGRSLVLRREDLLPKTFLAESALASIHIFGQSAIDIFKPTYGDASSNNARRFSFLFSKALFTTNVSWLLCNRLERPGEFLQGLIFNISTAGIPNPHLKINLGATAASGVPPSILTVITSRGNFKLNVSPLSFRSFTIILNGPTDTLSLVFRSDENDPNAVCEFQSFELFDTIFIDPFPVLEIG